MQSCYLQWPQSLPWSYRFENFAQAFSIRIPQGTPPPLAWSWEDSSTWHSLLGPSCSKTTGIGIICCPHCAWPSPLPVFRSSCHTCICNEQESSERVSSVNPRSEEALVKGMKNETQNLKSLAFMLERRQVQTARSPRTLTSFMRKLSSIPCYQICPIRSPNCAWER